MRQVFDRVVVIVVFINRAVEVRTHVVLTANGDAFVKF